MKIERDNKKEKMEIENEERKSLGNEFEYEIAELDKQSIPRFLQELNLHLNI